ncbi:hypothetical protein [Paenibacillus sp. GP183]|uniref:hypothetical protein n=1 Tax=Paenibacillus sp. GP183 TaxID=1882751 RepID=UPI00089510C4|nr:hypothetical protein [Paenibacillus sp. GP183]SEC29712.1 hypothetical protein SAMN05443246_3623 [Paenibacillus sp. GP183]
MNPFPSSLDEVNLVGKLADLKESHYLQSLLISALIDTLMDKGIITAEELALRAHQLDLAATPHPLNPIS